MLSIREVTQDNGLPCPVAALLWACSTPSSASLPIMYTPQKISRACGCGGFSICALITKKLIFIPYHVLGIA